jgi:hypothetical protein
MSYVSPTDEEPVEALKNAVAGGQADRISEACAEFLGVRLAEIDWLKAAKARYARRSSTLLAEMTARAEKAEAETARLRQELSEAEAVIRRMLRAEDSGDGESSD